MTINLFTEKGRIERSFHTVGRETYEVFPSHPAYEYLFDASLSATAMTAAICMNKGIDFPDNGYLGLSGKSLDYTVHIPAHATIEMALKLTDPEHIPLSIEWRKKEKQHRTWAPRLSKWMHRSVYSGFVDLYEKNKTSIHKHGGDAARIGKLLRDSISHKERITANPRDLPISWHGLSFKNEDRGKDISDHFLFGDVLIIAIAMFDRRNYSLPPDP
jgi:hypothetical protein